MSPHLSSTPLRHRAGGRRAAVVAAFAAAGLLATAGPAAADSIVYIDGGNVWSASPDGSHKVQLTDGGDWHSPTQSDNGKIAAVEGASNLITVMAPDGRPLHTIATQPAKSGDGATFAPRPVQLSFSPDGGRIAYAYVQNSCSNGSTCGTIQRSTFYTYENVNDATPQSLFGEQFSVSDPEWMTNDRVVVTGGYGTGLSFDDLAGGGDSSFTHWVPWPDKDVNDAEVSRDGSRLVMVWDYGQNTELMFSSIAGNPLTSATPADPVPSCNTSRDANFADPSWSPDGTAIAVHDSDGIDILRFSGMGPNHCELSSSTTFGPGTEPDWGPANPPAARYSAAPASGGTPAGQTGGSGATVKPGSGAGGNVSVVPGGQPANAGAANAPGGTPSVTSPSVKLADLRRGKATLKVSVPSGGRVTVTLSSGATTIATAHATAKGAGSVSVTLSKAGRRALAGLKGRRSALVRVTVAAKGAERLEGSGPIRVR
ncbi:MAG: hypothetical protein AAGC46_08325 [Solirubrobacteraceae bacterium]|nr:hypothetical protein [Patulibacter sp.]